MHSFYTLTNSKRNNSLHSFNVMGEPLPILQLAFVGCWRLSVTGLVFKDQVSVKEILDLEPYNIPHKLVGLKLGNKIVN